MKNLSLWYFCEVHEFEIDNNETFGTLRRKVAEAVKIPNNSLILVGREEYSREFNSKILSKIEVFWDGVCLYAIFSI